MGEAAPKTATRPAALAYPRRQGGQASRPTRSIRNRLFALLLLGLIGLLVGILLGGLISA